MHDSFILLVAWMSALYCSSSSTISLLPNLHANMSGVLPKLSFSSISAPNSIRLLTHAYLFFSIARDSGVLSSLSSGSTPHPLLIRARITWRDPAYAAKCIGVRSCWPLSLKVMLTSRPWSKNKLAWSSLSSKSSWSSASVLRHLSKCSFFLVFCITSLHTLHLVELR